jgi:hypothetical protein
MIRKIRICVVEPHGSGYMATFVRSKYLNHVSTLRCSSFYMLETGNISKLSQFMWNIMVGAASLSGSAAP